MLYYNKNKAFALPTLTTIDTTSFLTKCYIHWKTRNYGRKVEHIALLLAVAIYMNKNIYEEELESANDFLLKIMHDEKDDVENVMDYVKMKLGLYQEDNSAWMKDRQEAFHLIVKDEELYTCMIDIFHSDESFDENEELFEAALKRLL